MCRRGFAVVLLVCAFADAGFAKPLADFDVADARIEVRQEKRAAPQRPATAPAPSSSLRETFRKDARVRKAGRTIHVDDIGSARDVVS